MDNDLYFMRPEEDRERPEPKDLPVYSQAFSEPLEEERSYRGPRFSWPRG